MDNVASKIVSINGEARIGGAVVLYRKGTSDERVFDEVVCNRGYRRVRMGFDVMPDETWLDLGANIGAFAIYCMLRGAKAVCYEPDPDCFELLGRNVPHFSIFRTAVTNRHEDNLPFWKGRLETDHYRQTAYPTSGLPAHPCGTLPNMHGSYIKPIKGFDGIKMDIEGAEAGLLDDDLLPLAEKLCIEYHTSRDASMKNLERRLNFLKARYKVVSYPPEYDRLIAAGEDTKTFFDRLIFCKGLR